MTWWKEFQENLRNGRTNEEILLMLKKVAIKDARDRDGNNLLHYLANSKTDNEDLAAFLIKCGCNVDEKNNEDDTPLLIATKFECEKIIKLLLKAGANCNDVNRLGFTPLELLFRIKDSEDVNITIAKLLIQSGSNVNFEFDSRQSLLHFCVNNMDNADLIDLVLKAGAEVDAVDEFNQTPLFFAVFKNNYKIAKSLICAGADVNWSDEDGKTCLFHSATFLHPKLVKLLLDNGADVQKLDVLQHTPLHSSLLNIGICILEDYHDLMYTVGDRVKSYEDNMKINSPGMVDKLLQCLKLLIQDGADINLLNAKTPLGLAILFHHRRITKFLLNHGAVFDYNSRWDDDALHLTHNIRAAQELLRWTAMRKIQGTDDNGIINFNIENLKKKIYRDFYENCEIELTNMKLSLIHCSTTYFDVLVNKKINSYTRNLKVIDEFKGNLIFKRFPIYGDLLHKRIQNALIKQKIFNEAIEGLCRITKFNESSNHLILENICQYLMKKDLDSLREV